MIAYQTAYLKAHYPVEFMAALLTCEMDNNDKVIRHMNECREMGIEMLPPDINESNRDFTAYQRKIRFGLAAVKNVGGAAIESITGNRDELGNFISLFDFCKRVDLRKVNRRVIESLIKCGAFDSTETHRSQMMAVLDKAIERAQRLQKDRISKQINMFDLFGTDGTSNGNKEVFPEIPEWSEEELLSYEKEALGFYISKHPLNRFKDHLIKYTNTDTLTILNQTNDREIRIGGIINKMREIITRKGDRMCFITLEDLKGFIEVVVFSDLYQTCSNLLKSDQPIIVVGKVGMDGDNVKIIANQIVSFSEASKLSPLATHLTLNLIEINKEQLQLLKKLIISHPGDCQAFLHLVIPQKSETVISLGNDFKVNPSPQFFNEIKRLFGSAIRYTH